MGDFDAVAADSTNQTAGFIDSYADNSAGHPNVMTDRPDAHRGFAPTLAASNKRS
jgi:hypothetical protein